MSNGSQGHNILPRNTISYSYSGINPRMEEVKQRRTGRCLLALDGGDVRGFSQIEILHEISSRIKYDQGLEDWPCLCDYFDMIGGVGTGGYIAILIGRLALTTPVLKDEFMALLADVLAGPIEVTQLDNWLRELVKRHTGDPETLMFDPDSPMNHCKTFIGATTATNIAYQTKFRSYEVREGPNFNPPIWQVFRATLAHLNLFPGVKIGPDLIQQVYISGEFGWSNPSIEVIKEFESQWKRQNIGCLASIGTGQEGVIQIYEINGLIVPVALSGALERMATDCQRIADEVTNRFRGQNSYHRLSVEHGLDRKRSGNPVTLEEVVTHTNSYLRSSAVSVSVDALVRSLLHHFEVAPWTVTRERFDEALDSYILTAKESVEKFQIVEIKAAAQEVVVTLDNIRSTTSNEEQWLTLIKVIDNHLNLMLQLRGPLSAIPIWDSINGYFKELESVQRNVKSLLNVNPHGIWGPPVVEPFLSKWLWNLEECFKTIQGVLISDIHNRLHQRNQDQELEKLLGWLSPLKPQHRHEYMRAKRAEGTGSWFLNISEFQAWCNNENPQHCRALCSFGKPGAGKTVICSSVIDYLSENHCAQSGVALAFLYCDYQDRENQTGPNMIGGLAKQLMLQTRSIPQAIWEVFNNKNKEDKPVDSEVVKEFFSLMLDEFEVAYICIDAFDECEPQLRIQLLQLFIALSQTSLHIFITGRQSVEAEVTDALASLTPQNVPIVANEEDIRKCLLQRTASDPYPEAMDEKLKNEIIEKIVGLSQGIFLLPVLQIQFVLEHDTRRDRRLALSSIPTKLFDTYTATFDRIKQQPGTRPKRGLAVLTWVYLAQRQLQLVELRHALAVKDDDIAFDMEGVPSEKALLDCCLGLVVVEAETSIIRLMHFTLQEYLDRNWMNLFPLGHTTLATTCLTYLNFHHSFESSQLIGNVSLLINYVGYNIGHHLRNGSNPVLDQKAVAILRRKEKFQLLEQYFKGMLRRAFYFPCDDTYLITSPLHWAAYFGAVSIAELLLESAGIGVNAQDIAHKRTPLSYAAENGHILVVQLLLGIQGIDVDSRDAKKRTPLLYAAKAGQEGVVRLLVGVPGVDFNSRDKSGRTPLSYAARKSHGKVVQLILATPGVNVDSKDKSERTPLSYAACHSHEGIVQWLVGIPEVDVDSRDKNGRTPLSYAARNGQEGVAQLLLDTSGVDIDSRDKSKRTPLSYAASRNHEGVVRLLLVDLVLMSTQKTQKGGLHFYTQPPMAAKESSECW